MKFTALDKSIISDAANRENPVMHGLKAVVSSFRKAASDRALRRQLADLDSALLRDIGLNDEEIFRVRKGERFTPANWR